MPTMCLLHSFHMQTLYYSYADSILRCRWRRQSIAWGISCFLQMLGWRLRTWIMMFWNPAWMTLHQWFIGLYWDRQLALWNAIEWGICISPPLFTLSTLEGLQSSWTGTSHFVLSGGNATSTISHSVRQLTEDCLWVLLCRWSRPCLEERGPYWWHQHVTLDIWAPPSSHL